MSIERLRGTTLQREVFGINFMVGVPDSIGCHLSNVEFDHPAWNIWATGTCDITILIFAKALERNGLTLLCVLCLLWCLE